jgi:Holliday junction resolvase
MVETVSKGYRKEKLARDQLRKNGWFVAFKSVRFRFGCVDFAQLFDIVACKGKIWLFISVKHLNQGNYYLEHQREIKAFKDVYGFDGMIFQLWLWDKGRYTGRGKNKVWKEAEWNKIEV